MAHVGVREAAGAGIGGDGCDGGGSSDDGPLNRCQQQGKNGTRELDAIGE